MSSFLAAEWSSSKHVCQCRPDAGLTYLLSHHRPARPLDLGGAPNRQDALRIQDLVGPLYGVRWYWYNTSLYRWILSLCLGLLTAFGLIERRQNSASPRFLPPRTWSYAPDPHHVPTSQPTSSPLRKHLPKMSVRQPRCVFFLPFQSEADFADETRDSSSPSTRGRCCKTCTSPRPPPPNPPPPPNTARDGDAHILMPSRCPPPSTGCRIEQRDREPSHTDC